MTADELNKLENLKFLVVKSRNLLQEQLKSYEGANNKAGILISISALLIPIAVTFISRSDTILIIKYITILPIALMICALIFLLKVLMPKGLDHGFNFDQFEIQINKKQNVLLLYEIGANKDSYSDNIAIVQRQNGNFKKGIILIFSSSILIFGLVTVSLFASNVKSDKIQIEEVIIKKIEIDNLKMKTMSNNNSDSSSNGNQNQQNQQQTTREQTTRIPNVPREQRANIEKGETQKPLQKK